MPCDQVRQITLKFGEQTNLKALKLSLESEGFEVTERPDGLSYSKGYSTGLFNSKTGNFSHREDFRGFNLTNISAEYQRQNVAVNAESFGWQAEFDVDNRNKIKLRRRL